MPTDVLYIKCCILASQIPDTTNDILQRRDIKKIFTNTKNLNFDIEHQRKYLSGIEIVENYINQSEEHIKGTSIPPGSWIMVLAIYNNTLQQAIQTDEIRGVSLRTALGEDVNLTDQTLQGRIEYKDIINKEAMQPESVSFTNAPANEIPIEVMTYEAYTAKNKTIKGEHMTQHDDNSENSFWRKLFQDTFTAKNTAQPTPQPNNNLFSGVDAEEFINSMIESQKAIPKQNELIEKLVESQTKSIDAITDLQKELKQFKLNISNMKLAENTEEKPTEQEDTQTEENEENPEEEPQEQEQTTEEKIDPEENKDDPTQEQTTTPLQQEQEKDEKDKKEKHTAKSQKQRTLIQTNNNKDQEEILKFIANRSYENFMKN